MPSYITHALVGAAAGKIHTARKMPLRFWLLSMFCTGIVDLDVIAFNLGIPYESFFGHRGFFHSLFFAVLLALLVVCVFFRDRKLFSRQWWILWLYFSILGATHPLLDALTNGGWV